MSSQQLSQILIRFLNVLNKDRFDPGRQSQEVNPLTARP